MSEKTVRVAVLGQGRSGFGIHVRWLRGAANAFKLVAIADRMPERHEAAAELGAKAFTNFEQLLADKSHGAELVVNALPTHLHTPATIAALNAGYHVLSEKPFALNLADFDAMESAAKKSGKRLFAYQNSRFQPAFRQIQEILASGKLGKLLHARISFSNFARRWDWQASQRYGGGNINNTGPHPLDQAVMLFGERMPKVFSCLKCENAFGDADDLAAVSLYGDDAPLVEVLVSSFLAYPQGEMFNLSCTHGGLTGNPKDLKWRYFDPAVSPQHDPSAGWSDQRAYNSEKLTWIDESWTNPQTADAFQQMSSGLYGNVYDVLVHGAEPVVRLEQVRRQIAVLEQCHQQNPLPTKSGSAGR